MADHPGFSRDRVTVLAYGALGCYAFYLYALGPVLAFLHTELHLSYTLTSLHSSLWALGTIVTGAVFDRFSRRVGRHAVFWASAGGTVAGGLLFVTGHAIGLTLLAAGVLGTAGSLLQTGTAAVLADRHGPLRDRALVESNIGASLAAVLAPVALGFLDGTPAGWRAGLLLPAVALVALFAAYGRDPLPATPTPSEARAGGRLSAAYWLACLLIAAVVAVEFCVVFYGAILLHRDTAVSTAAAASAMSLFYVGELAGRVAGGGLTRQPGRTRRLVLGALVVTAVGFLVFWLSGWFALAAVGLFVTGLGVANLYPLCLALALAAAPGRTDEAAARTQVAIGFAVLAAPLALGALADRVGVFLAFIVEPALIGAALLLLAATARLRPRRGLEVG